MTYMKIKLWLPFNYEIDSSGIGQKYTNAELDWKAYSSFSLKASLSLVAKDKFWHGFLYVCP